MYKKRKKRRILLISNMYPSKIYPHYGVFIQNSEYILKNGGFEIDKITMAKQDSSIVKAMSYLRFYLLAGFKIVFGRYDCVYAHYASHMKPVAVLAKKLRPKLPLVINVHGNDIVPTSERDYRNPSRSRRTLDLSDCVIAPSGYFKQVLRENYSVPEEKVFIFPSGGINTEIFYPKDKEKVREKLGFTGEQVLIGYASRIEPGKGWDIFLEGVRSLHGKFPHVQYILIGEGSQLSMCREVIRQNNMENYGYLYPLVSQDKLADYYNVFDVFCFPSLQESLGLVGLEAMACGVPCVVSHIPGILAYAEDNWNCITFEAGDSTGLEAAISKVLGMNAEEKAILKKNQMDTAAKYAAEKVSGEFLNIFLEM